MNPLEEILSLALTKLFILSNKVCLTWWERCHLQMRCLQLSVQYGSIDGLGSKLRAVIEASFPWGSALIANKVYLLPTTETIAQQSVFDPCLPSLCGLIMKVRITLYTQSHTGFPKLTQPLTVIRYRQDNYSKESCMKHLRVLTHTHTHMLFVHASPHTDVYPHRRSATQFTWQRFCDRLQGSFSTVLISQPKRRDNSV